MSKINDFLRSYIAIANNLSFYDIRAICDLQNIIHDSLCLDLGIDLGFDLVAIPGQGGNRLAAMPQRRFPRPWPFESIPGGYRVIDANGMALAHVYGQPPDAVAFSDKRLTDGEAEKLARLIARLPELVEIERDRNRARSRRKPQPLRIKPVTIGDLIKSGKLLEVHCSSCRPARHLYIDAGSLDLPKRLPVPQIADHLVCSVCGAKNSDTYHPIWARPEARVPGVTGRPDFNRR